MNEITKQKIERIKSGERVVVSSKELDFIGEEILDVRSIPNPNRVGILDVYVAYVL